MTVDQSNEVLPPVDAVDYPEGFGWVLTRYRAMCQVALREREVSIDHKAGDEGRWERAIRAIAASKLSGTDFADWVQSVCDDVMDGNEAECPECATCVHEGPCVAAEEFE